MGATQDTEEHVVICFQISIFEPLETTAALRAVSTTLL